VPVALGVLGALAFLARTDAALIVVALTLWTLPLAWRDRRFGPLALVTVPPAVTAGVYLALNQWAFGSPLQISGVVKRKPLDAVSAVVFAAAVALALAAGVRAWRLTFGGAPPRHRRFPRLDGVAATTAWFGLSAVLIAVYYQVLQTQQWLWYFAPVVLVLVVLLVLAVADVVAFAQQGEPATAGRRVAAVGGVVVVVPLAVGLVVQVRSFADPTVRSIQRADRDAAVWIDANLPAGARLASWDAGVLGYFSHRPVVNLDGVVNSFAWDEAVRAGNAGSILRCEGVGWIVNHGPGGDGDDPEIVGLIERVWGADAEQVHRVPFLYSGTTNAGGVEAGPGVREQATRVYRVDPARVGPRAGDSC
jgi:hypothetical protein